MCVCVCVCERERERERDAIIGKIAQYLQMYVCYYNWLHCVLSDSSSSER